MESTLITPAQIDPAPTEGPSRYGAPRQSRYVAALLSLGVCALIVLALLQMARLQGIDRASSAVLTALRLEVPPEVRKEAKTPKAANAREKPQHTEPAAANKPLPHVEVNNPNKDPWPEGFIHTDHRGMVMSDIANIHSGITPGKAQATGGGGHGDGEGPDSSGYYKAEWYRKPPRTALDSYMKPGQNPGRWADIACRMVENYHVEDCHELAEEPRGTGMSHVLRQAAWQFLVRPPRRDGKPLIGEWVRIRYDFVREKIEDVAPQTGESP